MMKKTLCLLMTAFMAFSVMPVHAASYNYTRYQYKGKDFKCTKSKVSIPLPAAKYENTPANVGKVFTWSAQTWHPVKVTKKGHTIVIHTEAVNPNKYLKKGIYRFGAKPEYKIYTCLYEWNNKKKKWKYRYDDYPAEYNGKQDKFYDTLEYTKNNKGKYKLHIKCEYILNYLYYNNKKMDLALAYPKVQNQYVINLNVKNKKVREPGDSYVYHGDYVSIYTKTTLK